MWGAERFTAEVAEKINVGGGFNWWKDIDVKFNAHKKADMFLPRRHGDTEGNLGRSGIWRNLQKRLNRQDRQERQEKTFLSAFIGVRTSVFNLLRRGLRVGWVGVVVVALGVSGCERGEARQAAMPARPPAQVTVAAAVARDVPVYLEEIGKTVSVETVSVVPQVGGKIVAAPVENGATVKKGQLLFEIDPRPFEADLASAKAALAQNKALLELTRIEFKRVQGLVASSAVSQAEYDQKKNAVDVALARVAAGEAAVETAQLKLEYARIYSPIDGRAGARLVDAGNVVKENDKPLLVIQRLDPIYAEFTVTENDLGTVRKYLATAGLDLGLEPHNGLKVEVDVPGDSEPVLAALGNPTPATQPGRNTGGPRMGTLVFLDNTVQDGSGTVKVRAVVPNADRYFWPGQFVRVRLVLMTAKDAVLVPAQSVQISQQGPFVYVVKPDGVAEQRPVTPGQRQGELVVIREGVQAGEKVVTSGQMMIVPGGKVMVTHEGNKGA